MIAKGRRRKYDRHAGPCGNAAMVVQNHVAIIVHPGIANDHVGHPATHRQRLAHEVPPSGRRQPGPHGVDEMHVDEAVQVTVLGLDGARPGGDLAGRRHARPCDRGGITADEIIAQERPQGVAQVFFGDASRVDDAAQGQSVPPAARGHDLGQGPAKGRQEHVIHGCTVGSGKFPQPVRPCPEWCGKGGNRSPIACSTSTPPARRSDCDSIA